MYRTVRAKNRTFLVHDRQPIDRRECDCGRHHDRDRETHVLTPKNAAMSILSALPNRPLAEQDVATLNRSDAFDLVIATAESGPTVGLIIATEEWVKGLSFGEGGWAVVETVRTTGKETRFDGLKRCETAVVDAIGQTHS